MNATNTIVHKGPVAELVWVFAFQDKLIGASLSEPHTYVENGAVVNAQTITVKNGIATNYCSFGRVVHLQTDTINLRILP